MEEKEVEYSFPEIMVQSEMRKIVFCYRKSSLPVLYMHNLMYYYISIEWY